MILDGKSKVGRVKVYGSKREMYLQQQLDEALKDNFESRKMIGEMQEVIDKQNEALSFYGDRESKCCFIDGESMSIREKGAEGYLFGKKARQVLSDDLVKKYTNTEGR